MTPQEQLYQLAQTVGLDIKSLLAKIGDLGLLQSMTNADLVSALNEIHGQVLLLEQSILLIDGSVASLDKVYSSTKLEAIVTNISSAVLGGEVNPDFDTLIEVYNYLSEKESYISDILNRLGNKLRFDTTQSLTPLQIETARGNIGVGAENIQMELEYFLKTDNNSYIEPGYLRPGYFV